MVWEDYKESIVEKYANWMRDEGVASKEAIEHASKTFNNVPDVFTSKIKEGTVLNFMKDRYIGDGVITVFEDGVKHEANALWMVVNTSKGPQFFGICYVPDTSTGHLLAIKADKEFYTV